MSDADQVPGQASKPARDRSTVEFPYSDLDEATSVVRVIHQSGGLPMDRDQIAVRLGQKVSSGAFVTKIGASRMFGLIEAVPGSGKVQISPLGHEILSADEARVRAARAKAFLNVELYRKLYDEFRGRQLPPRPLGLEQAIVGFGVAPKQKTNARYAFDRSAKQAGYFEHGQDQLVAPVAGVGVPEKPQHSSPEEEEDVRKTPKLDGVITALIDKLPPSGSDWPTSERKRWLTMMVLAADMAYGETEGGKIKIDFDRSSPSLTTNSGDDKNYATGFSSRRRSKDDEEIPF